MHLQVSRIQTQYSAERVPAGFKYNSGDNPDFLTVDEITSLIKQNIDPDFKPI